MKCDPIAVVRSCFGGKFGVPRQPGLSPAAWGEVVFHEPYRSREAVRGLEGFSHLWLIFGFHQTVEEGWRPTVRPPRLGGDERVGVFASRSTYRPNGLGLSVVRLEGIDLDRPDGPVLKLGGVDLVDGTPIFDIKPYLAYSDSIPDAASGYAPDKPEVLTVEVDALAERVFSGLPERTRAVLTEVLALDPRPAVRKEEGRTYGAVLCGMNVRFRISAGVCRIVEISPDMGSGLND
ncbi:MAG: tRNA (N6-threonylcarbamoyladenosine(37)-N6)-methyltransferase TrmO [Verrucomicrobiaceae bacterium]|nr:MAG: tRNA (N6-threonylcarbamoyladenosine(37)-N6)-methyltransferase TrmO [Verrucomicrobiaceae bacterium]